MSWQLTLCLLLSWLLVYACVVKGVKSSGKAVYFTATFPYLILIILLIAGALLSGADIGLVAFFKPDVSEFFLLSFFPGFFHTNHKKSRRMENYISKITIYLVFLV